MQMNIKELLSNIRDEEESISRMRNALSGVSNFGFGKITDNGGSWGEPIPAKLLIPVLEEQIKAGEAKLSKLLDAKETAERVIKGLLDD